MSKSLEDVYFRVKRDGKWDDVCFSRLAYAENFGISAEEESWMADLCLALLNSINGMEDQFSIVASFRKE